MNSPVLKIHDLHLDKEHTLPEFCAFSTHQQIDLKYGKIVKKLCLVNVLNHFYVS